VRLELDMILALGSSWRNAKSRKGGFVTNLFLVFRRRKIKSALKIIQKKYRSALLAGESANGAT
jgi:hypothetical protein